jgi:hypothetical protein
MRFRSWEIAPRGCRFTLLEWVFLSWSREYPGSGLRGGLRGGTGAFEDSQSLAYTI